MFGFQLIGHAAESTAHNWDAWSWYTSNGNKWLNSGQNLTGGGTPDPSDDNTALVDGNTDLYLENWSTTQSVNILDHWFGTGGLGLTRDNFRYWAMDNEPDIWHITHDDVVKTPPTAEQFRARYFAAAKTARAKFPGIKLVGPIAANEWFWYDWAGGGTTVNGRELPWLEYFIKRVAEEQAASGVRLIDVLALHFYPGSTNTDQLTQYHRVFFDDTYVFPEANGVKTVNGGWDNTINKEYIFKRCQQWLTQYMGPNHGVTFGLTECGIKPTDANVAAVWYASTMGEFMKQGVELFTPWTWRLGMWETLHLNARYNQPTTIRSTSSDEQWVSAYGTKNTAGTNLTVVLVNRSTTAARTVTLNPANFTLANQAFTVRTLDNLPTTETFVSATQNALATTTVSKSSNTVTLTLPTLSVTSIQLVGTTGSGNAPATYQGENRTAQSGTTNSTAHTGYTGTGFADLGGNGTWIEWNNVTRATAGTANIVVRYANGGTANRPVQLRVNGTLVGTYTQVPTGSWTTWQTQTLPATLSAGNNTVRLTVSTTTGGANIDKIDVP